MSDTNNKQVLYNKIEITTRQKLPFPMTIDEAFAMIKLFEGQFKRNSAYADMEFVDIKPVKQEKDL